MRDDFDVEDAMRRYEAGPSARVKKTVLDRFGNKHAPMTRRPVFWRKPIPLYAAATALVVAVGLSFAAGRTTSRAAYRPGTTIVPAGPDTVMTSVEIQWVPAENDLL